MTFIQGLFLLAWFYLSHENLLAMVRLPDDSSDAYFREAQSILAEGGVMLEITNAAGGRVSATVGQWKEDDPLTDQELITWALAIFTPLGYGVDVEHLPHFL